MPSGPTHRHRALQIASRSRLGRGLAVLALAGAMTFAATGTAAAQSGGTDPGGGTTTTPTTPTTPTPTPGVYVFPIAGTHYYGQGFGAARGRRGHMGQDIFAACGTMLVSAYNGPVVFKGFHGAAGNYVVIRNKKLRQDYMYAHLAAPSPVAVKQKVLSGQWIGAVGATGNASGCHLHFEIWGGKWYRGGRAIDPLATLLLWDPAFEPHQPASLRFARAAGLRRGREGC
jgi:murein DD-endopeptidase MepM/ murein hydrolase activator NlpD